jgi:hypothetical protein
MADGWTTFGNVANTAGVAGAILTGASSIAVGYQTYASPHTALTECMKRLEEVRKQIDGISEQRRLKIESAANQPGATCKRLEDLEEQLQEYVLLNITCSLSYSYPLGVSSLSDTQCRLSKWYEDTAYILRHLPKTQLRKNITALENDVKTLQQDTWVIVIPFLNLNLPTSFVVGDNCTLHQRHRLRHLQAEGQTTGRRHPDWFGIDSSLNHQCVAIFVQLYGT